MNCGSDFSRDALMLNVMGKPSEPVTARRTKALRLKHLDKQKHRTPLINRACD